MHDQVNKSYSLWNLVFIPNEIISLKKKTSTQEM